MAVKWPLDHFFELVSTVNPYDGMGAKHGGMGGDIHRKSIFTAVPVRECPTTRAAC